MVVPLLLLLLVFLLLLFQWLVSMRHYSVESSARFSLTSLSPHTINFHCIRIVCCGCCWLFSLFLCHSFTHTLHTHPRCFRISRHTNHATTYVFGLHLVVRGDFDSALQCHRAQQQRHNNRGEKKTCIHKMWSEWESAAGKKVRTRTFCHGMCFMHQQMHFPSKRTQFYLCAFSMCFSARLKASMRFFFFSASRCCTTFELYKPRRLDVRMLNVLFTDMFWFIHDHTSFFCPCSRTLCT